MKKYAIAFAALLAGVGIAIPLATGASIRAVTTVTQCPSGISPPSKYCSTSVVTTPDAVTTTNPSSGEVTTSADSTGVPKVSADSEQYKAAASQAQSSNGGQPVTFVGQVGTLLVFIPSDLPPLTKGGSDTISSFTFVAQADGTVNIAQTLYLHRSASKRDVAFAAKHENTLSPQKKDVKAGQVVKVTAKPGKSTMAGIQRAGSAYLATTVTTTDQYGTHKTAQLQKLPLKTKKP